MSVATAQQVAQKMEELVRNSVNRMTESVYNDLLRCAADADNLSSFLDCVEAIDGRRGEVARAIVMNYVGSALGKQYSDWSTFRKSLSNDLYDTVKTVLLSATMPPTLPPPTTTTSGATSK